MKVRLERRYRFSASHLYRRPEWSEEENRARFGKCANLPGHGHNYRLFVTVRGEVDPETGFVVDLGALDSWVQAAVLEPLTSISTSHCRSSGRAARSRRAKTSSHGSAASSWPW
jgi:6-pyruvoyltetrahydropterin/6-carboxytetrahydropterin synthase